MMSHELQIYLLPPTPAPIFKHRTIDKTIPKIWHPEALYSKILLLLQYVFKMLLHSEIVEENI